MTVRIPDYGRACVLAYQLCAPLPIDLKTTGGCRTGAILKVLSLSLSLSFSLTDTPLFLLTHTSTDMNFFFSIYVLGYVYFHLCVCTCVCQMDGGRMMYFVMRLQIK